MKPKTGWCVVSAIMMVLQLKIGKVDIELIILQCTEIIAFYLSYIVEILKGEDK